VPEIRTSFAAAHEDAMEFPEEQGLRDPVPAPLPKHIMEGSVSDDRTDARAYADDAVPPVTQASDRMATDVVSLDRMRSAIVSNLATNMSNNFEPDDLDVPAFLRKRNEVM
jgi:hypothetical protein